VLLLVAAVGLGLYAGSGGAPPIAAVPTPDGASPDCARLLARLPARLDSDAGPLTRVAPADVPAGALAWAAGDPSGGPVVLRCGVARPAGLRPTSELIDVDGVGWLTSRAPGGSGDAAPDDVFVAADRSVFVQLEVPHGSGTGPVQTFSDVIGAVLPRVTR
jgi:hypothetical protein